MKAYIFDIKKFAVHDGNGIRTTVFFKGCPLHCIWCHNPEGLAPIPQIAYFENKCINCGICTGLCNANHIKKEKHVFNREYCTYCRKCEEECPSGCFRIYGKEYTTDELLTILTEDKGFYDASGGGITLSGGECLLFPDFCAELLKKCKENGINTAVDTCGYVPQASIENVIPYTDTFLYDIKAFDEDVHISCTGHSNRLILDNLKYITDQNKSTEIRFPFVPNHNSDQTEKIAHFLSTLRNVPDVKILPLHNMSNSKYTALDMTDCTPQTNYPGSAELNNAIQIFSKYNIHAQY